MKEIGLIVTTLLLVTSLAKAFLTPFSNRPGAVRLVGSGYNKRSRQVWMADSDNNNSNNNKYVRQYEDQPVKKTKKLYPQAGDIVRFYDLDGGREDGEVLVGKIAFIQKQLGTSGGKDQWMVEVVEMEDVGDGYYAEYSSRQRESKKTMRMLDKVAPISASFVRSENAYKVPRALGTNTPIVRAEQYDLEDYEGPFSGLNAINQTVVAEDLITYGKLKIKLFKQAAIAGGIGTLITSIGKGTEDAILYFAGALASVFYLFFLTIKTDSIASTKMDLGKNVSNLRFVMPLIVLTAVALYNQSLGDANPVVGRGLFSTVTPEQFACISIGFLTYRIPLFVDQIGEYLGDSSAPLGSAGVAIQLAKNDATDELSSTAIAAGDPSDLTPVLLVSGPQAAGRTELVDKLVAEGSGRFVLPELVDRIEDGARFERMEGRNEFLRIDPSGRYGLTTEGILTASSKSKDESVVVVDADVDLTKKLAKIPGARLIGVWIGLDATEKFQASIESQIESGQLEIPEEETKESFVRVKIKEIVKEIEYGLVSGIFEFTILNDDMESSMAQLRAASEYCFK